jgi:AraC family transcriptional activator of pobA
MEEFNLTNHIQKEATIIPDKTFPINVFSVFREIKLHWHDHLEWIYVKQGEVQLQIDDTITVLHKGELAFINSKQLHGALPLGEHTEMVAVVYHETLLRNSGLDSTESRYFVPILSHQLQLPNILKVEDPLSRQIIISVSRIIEEFEDKNPGFELFIKAELFQLFGLFVRYNTELRKIKNNLNRQDDVFAAFFKQLRENYYNSISLSEAARMVNMSPNHFCSVFKKTTGRTLVEYVNILRVYEAETMLAETAWSIDEISRKVGFNNITYFGRVIKKYKNMTPTELRKTLQS